MNFKKLLPGALVAAGLVTACGGEVQETGAEQGDPRVIESGLTTYYTTALGETVPCVTGSASHQNAAPYTLSGCTLAENFTHTYRDDGDSTTPPFTVQFVAGKYLNVPGTGLIGAGYINGDQSLYVGAVNGSVLLDSGSTVGFRTNSLATGMVYTGSLAADTCLWKNSTTKVICAGVNYSIQFTSGGYVYGCTVLGPC
ncbi:hypothetical protein ATI61_110227 [Archangium gephyra]|nr:hypothetical protein [Archangium gephyra]REG27220.1 hypothetical protein ATI61_110227 [Archangium gephyra]